MLILAIISVSKSIFFPDEAINKHPRFSTLTANIRRRRGRKVCINIPGTSNANSFDDYLHRIQCSGTQPRHRRI